MLRDLKDYMDLDGELSGVLVGNNGQWMKIISPKGLPRGNLILELYVSNAKNFAKLSLENH